MRETWGLCGFFVVVAQAYFVKTSLNLNGGKVVRIQQGVSKEILHLDSAQMHQLRVISGCL